VEVASHAAAAQSDKARCCPDIAKLKDNLSLYIRKASPDTTTQGTNGGETSRKMIKLEDCIGLCGLTEEEVLAIAGHEHLPEIPATPLAQYLLSQEHGSDKVRDIIVDDIRHAQRNGDIQHVLTLLHVLHHFLKTHPEAKPVQHPWSGRR
jgi:hypothetical protein